MTEKKKAKTRAKKSAKKSGKSVAKSSTGTETAGNRSQSDQGAAQETFGGPDRIHAFASTLASQEPGEVGTTSRQLETWVTFRLAGETFSLPVTAVQEILRVDRITPVPHAPYTVRGIINMRGRVVPVVDFRVRLSLPEAQVEAQSRILITSSRDHLVGLLVDSVEQVVTLDMTTVEPPPKDIVTVQSEYIVGVCSHGGELLFLLDVEPVLLVPDSLEELNQREAKKRTGSIARA